MKRKIGIASMCALVTMLLIGCGSSLPRQNPCRDKMYIQLQSKDLDSMSNREFAYFQTKSAECERYNAIKEGRETLDGWMSGLLFLGILSAVVSAIIILAP